MICSECGREHVITGEIRVDGVVLHPALIETDVEIACKHGWLIPKPERDERIAPGASSDAAPIAGSFHDGPGPGRARLNTRRARRGTLRRALLLLDLTTER